MSKLREQIQARFPEVRDALDPEDGDYTLMHRIVEWLRARQPGAHSPNVVERLQHFKEWCEEQPRTQTAVDDIWTIFIVGFWEHLFESDSTRPLVPLLMSREELAANRDYLTSWVGAENYQMALDQYDRTV